jgi:hypothetical protein
MLKASCPALLFTMPCVFLAENLPCKEHPKNHLNTCTCSKCLVLISERVFDTLLAIAIEDKEKRLLNRMVWAALAAFNAELLKPLDNPDADQRSSKAIAVQDRTVIYVENFAAAVGRELCTLYMHLAADHIPDMVRRFPVNFSDLSQQFVEAALKGGKTDAHAFTNKQLRRGGMDKGRNFQCFSKERERGHLKKTVAVPLSRNERRVLGNKSKVAAKIVERARQRGQLANRSRLQLEKRVDKTAPDLAAVVARIQITRLTQGFAAAGSPPSNSPPASPVLGSGPPEASGAGTARASGEVEADAGGAEVRPEAGGRGGSEGGRGRGFRGGRGTWGGRGRGRGRIRPATARDL